VNVSSNLQDGGLENNEDELNMQALMGEGEDAENRE
jgi:hypothetical protein